MSNVNSNPWEIEKIIYVAKQLVTEGCSSGSTGEVIAGAFALDKMEFLPYGYSVIESWERLEPEWQGYVKEVRAKYMHRLV